MKKIFIIFLGILLTTSGYIIYKYYLSDTKNINSVYLIPRDAIYFVASNKPIQNWKKIRNSETWQHLQSNSYFSKLTTNADTLDKILKDNAKLFDLLGSKRLLISAHLISNRDYDFLYFEYVSNVDIEP